MIGRLNPSMASRVQVVYYHSMCPDGITSREILKLLPLRIETRPYDFGRELSQQELEEITKRPTLFIDCHPNLDQLQWLVDNSDVMIADHHDTLKDHCNAIPEGRLLFGESSQGESGATLAIHIVEYLGLNAIPAIARHQAELIAISDTWQNKDPRFPKARALANYLNMVGNAIGGFVPMDVTDVLAQSMASKAKSIADHAILRTVDDLKIAFISTVETSDAAEILRQRGIDLVIGHKILRIDGVERINYSIRSNDKLHARVIAERMNGGGHDCAAGGYLLYNEESPINAALSVVEEVWRDGKKACVQRKLYL